MIKALATDSPSSKLKPFEYDPGPLPADVVEIKVEHCGICHSDLSMKNNDWGMTQYPFVPGHEVVGTISRRGDAVTHLGLGQRVGLGWYSGSCSLCSQCMSGNQNLCSSHEQTIVGRHGGFATHVRSQALWAIPIPEGVSADKAGPLLCGGITVFNPLIECGVKPTDRVGVVGIGGLGHMALQFLNAWGCEVVAFSSTAGKADQAKGLGAHRVVNSRSEAELSSLSQSLDFIISTVNVDLEWQSYLSCLAPKGRLHFVGAVPNPVPVAVFPMISKQASVSGSPLGSPATTSQMLEFCSRHQIAPVVEYFPMSQANEAFEHLEAGKARYRIILQNDLA